MCELEDSGWYTPTLNFSVTVKLTVLKELKFSEPLDAESLLSECFNIWPVYREGCC